MTSGRLRRPSSFFDKSIPEIALKSLFAKYDQDANGTLDGKELNLLLKEDLGMNPDQAEVYHYLLDKDGDNKVSFQEFCAWLRSNEDFESVSDNTRFYYLSKAIDLFKQFDTDNNQALDREEFRNLYLQAGGDEEGFNKALVTLDVDDNGRISFQEFLKWLNWVNVDDVFHP